ncbi:MAG: hypothetical protein AAGE59_28080 [Cyanobacteria bacterium P01_F01_bin.86]
MLDFDYLTELYEKYLTRTNDPQAAAMLAAAAHREASQSALRELLNTHFEELKDAIWNIAAPIGN